MSELSTLARPYAEAAYKRARETGSVEQWTETLDFLAAVMADERVARAAANPKASRERFADAFLDLCRDHVDREQENFIRLLIQNHRLNAIGSINELFRRYRAEHEGSVDVDVASAFALDEAETNRLAAALQAYLGKKPNLRISIDPTLIGGVFIRAGDFVVDGSIRGQLERMAKRLCN